jgi:hypothetical protein
VVAFGRQQQLGKLVVTPGEALMSETYCATGFGKAAIGRRYRKKKLIDQNDPHRRRTFDHVSTDTADHGGTKMRKIK